MVLRRCQSCKEFYEKKLSACPSCGVEKYGFSKHLRTAELNNHLYAAAEQSSATAKRENRMVRDARRES